MHRTLREYTGVHSLKKPKEENHMDVTLDLYLKFEGQALEALRFYEAMFDVKHNYLMMYSDIPSYAKTEEQKNWVAHASFRLGGTQINLGDDEDAQEGGRTAVMLRHDALADTKALYDRFLQEGAQALMPFTQTFYSPGYAVVRDRFGVTWHLYTNETE